MTTTFELSPNCFFPERVPVRIGFEGYAVGYADGFVEKDGVVTGTIHFDEYAKNTLAESKLKPVGLSHWLNGEPEVLDCIALIDTRCATVAHPTAFGRF